MLEPHLLGKEGESLGAKYLAKKGYRIIERNYRYHRNEIDIIARHNKTLCFVEVKTRSSAEKGHPAESVTPAKQKEIIKAAKAYLAFTGQNEADSRFDVIAVSVDGAEENHISSCVIEHFIDAFWATS
jgi:putative endonuclease